ncbi:MAG TPA: serine hydrolase [Chlamydiales bacterium]|nr:serine hydrolase [Chlamydiales bacterium]
MHKILFLILLLPLVAFPHELTALQPQPVNKQQDIQLAMDSVIVPFMKRKEIPGVAIALYCEDEGGTICYGFTSTKKTNKITSHTLFEIASITKVFTSTDLALEVQQGKMLLQDPITLYLPTMNFRRGAINNVTLQDLATHTSGLPKSAFARSGALIKDQEQLIEFLQDWRPDAPIGSEYVYSNLGFGLLGFALEDTQNSSYEQLITKDLLKPLHMDSTMVAVPASLMNLYAQGYSKEGNPVLPSKKSIIPASGALRSTAFDMLQFLKANLDVEGPSQIRQAMQMAQKGYYRINDTLTMGLGWQRVHLSHITIVEKLGGAGGFSSYIGMVPEKKLGIVILANRARVNCIEVGRFLLTHLAKQE